MARKKTEETIAVGMRLPVDIVRRADAHAAALSAEHPGLTFTRTDAIKMILAKHLPLLPGDAPLAPTEKPVDSSRPLPEKPSPAKRTAKRRP